MSDATPVHAENARLRKNRVFEPYPEATHLVRLDDAEDAVRRAFAAGRADAEQRVIDRLAREAGSNPYTTYAAQKFKNCHTAWDEGAACGVAAGSQDWQSMKRELAVICGGPGSPREGESEVAYWLRRVTDALIEERACGVAAERRRLAEQSPDLSPPEPQTPGEHLQWGKGWGVGKAHGVAAERARTEKLREALRILSDPDDPPFADWAFFHRAEDREEASQEFARAALAALAPERTTKEA